jgi:flagellar motor protein MotB
MNAVTRLGWLSLLCVTSTVFAASKVDEVTPLGEAVERHLSLDEPFTQWVQDPDRVDAELGDAIETRETVADALETVKLSNLVEPIRFESGIANIPEETVESLGAILERMRDRINVRLHLIGHADNRPLSYELQQIYGDNAGLSRERAGKVAEHFQTALALPAEAISYEWAGDTSPVASNLTEAGRALNRRVEVEVWYDEVVERMSLEEFLVPHEIKRVKVCRMETVCKLRYVEGHAHRARVQNLVPPLHYGTESIDVDDDFIARVDQAFENLADKQNVVVKFVGFTDNVPLSGRTERIYGDDVGLSKARARRVALAVQDSLNLPTFNIQSDGRGSIRPLGSNATERGRALNRRVEVEFWYDDPLQELPDEPQLCPGDAGAETVTKVYDPPWGGIADIDFADGRPVVRRLLTRPTRACASSAIHVMSAWRAAPRPSTATTSACLHRVRAVPWRKSPATCSSKRIRPSSRAVATYTRRTSSTPASSRARLRTSPCRSSSTNWQSSTTMKASTSPA